MECAIGRVARGHFLAQRGTTRHGGRGRAVGRVGAPGWRRGKSGALGGVVERLGATWANVGRLAANQDLRALRGAGHVPVLGWW